MEVIDDPNLVEPDPTMESARLSFMRRALSALHYQIPPGDTHYAAIYHGSNVLKSRIARLSWEAGVRAGLMASWEGLRERLAARKNGGS